MKMKNEMLKFKFNSIDIGLITLQRGKSTERGFFV